MPIVTNAPTSHDVVSQLDSTHLGRWFQKSPQPGSRHWTKRRIAQNDLYFQGNWDPNRRTCRALTGKSDVMGCGCEKLVPQPTRLNVSQACFSMSFQFFSWGIAVFSCNMGRLYTSYFITSSSFLTSRSSYQWSPQFVVSARLSQGG